MSFIIPILIFVIVLCTIYGVIKIERELYEFSILSGIEKVKTENTYGYFNFITEKEKKILLDLIITNLSHFKERTNNTELFATLQHIPNYPKKIINKLRDRIVKLEKIDKFYPDLIHEDAVSVIYDGGYHDYHKDMNYINWILVRYNIILSDPYSGGESVYGNEINKWREKTIWKCVAGLVKHGVTLVNGGKPRIVLCLGFMIPLDDVLKNQDKMKIEEFTTLPNELKYMEPI
jgi:hypothetical protein